MKSSEELKCDDKFGLSENKRYTRFEVRGHGAYGVVYKGKDIETDKIVAIKKIKIESEQEGIPGTALREISLLREINHPNIVPLLDVVAEDKKLFLIFEFLDGDLKEFIEKNEMPEKYIKSIAYQLLLGIKECHSKRIMHRDLKPQNILINKAKTGIAIKIADFGLARAFAVPIRPYTHEVVTLWYRAPEILLGATDYFTPVDMWSLGCILAEMYNKQALFMGDSEIDQLYKIFRSIGTPTETAWPGVSQLKHYKSTFPNWHSQQFQTLCPSMDKLALDLLSVDV
jgi:serine/threonine protein kinase